MIKKNGIIISALIICLAMSPLFTMGAQAASSQERGGADEEVRVALQQLKFAYASRDVMRMMSCLDGKYPGRLEFNAAVQNYFLNHKEIEILFYQDTVLEDRNMVNARVRWYKRAFTLTGAFQKTEGQCQLGFVRTGRTLKLYYIRGANPFF
jgi:hypothetical protein